MTDTTFVDKSTVIPTAWLNDVNTLRYGAGSRLRGSAQLQFIASGTGAVVQNTQDKIARDLKSVFDFGAIGDGIVDDTAAVLKALAAGNIVFPAPYTYKVTGAISIPANRSIVIDLGARVNAANRWTAYDVDNVHWLINGNFMPAGLPVGPSLPGWPGTSTGYFGDERGAIEFGGAVAASPRSNFSVSGVGSVGGDWVGTPATATATDVNFKGIAVFNAKDVDISIRDIYGFRGEQVYAFAINSASENIVFRNIHSHDGKFNALNFNFINTYKACVIRDCLTTNCYCGVEASAAEVLDCTIFFPLLNGIWSGAGSGAGPLTWRGNIVIGAGAISYYAAYSPTAIGPVIVEENFSMNSGAGGFQFEKVTQFSSQSNTSLGHGQTTASYAFAYVSATKGVIGNNVTLASGGSSLGSRFIDVSTVPVCSDISVAGDFTPTTGAAAPQVGNGCPVVASIAALTLPADTEVILVSGTVNITSMVATGQKGRRVTLIFQGILTFTKGNNLKIVSNFVTTADDTITLVCDGTNWYEVGRAVNS